MDTKTVTVMNGDVEAQVQIDASTQIYDPVRKVVYPIEKPVRVLIAELTTRLAATEARIAKLEAARK